MPLHAMTDGVRRASDTDGMGFWTESHGGSKRLLGMQSRAYLQEPLLTRDRTQDILWY